MSIALFTFAWICIISISALIITEIAMRWLIPAFEKYMNVSLTKDILPWTDKMKEL